MTGKLSRFFQELKRRNVYRAATVYAITSWIIIEVADTVFPHLGLPEWLVTAIIVFILMGFPVVLVLSWIYEMGPKGIIRTDSEEAEENLLSAGKKKPFTSTTAIVVLSMLLVAQFVYFGFIRKNNTRVLPDEVLNERVAVAPFNNFTGDVNLDAFGLMASEWITSGLRELDVQTSSPETMRKSRDNVGILPGNPENKISLFELTGAKFVVTGSYYPIADQIQVSSRIESTETGDIIYDFPTLSGPLDQKENLIGEIREKIKGYWAVKEADDLAIFSPPKYEAYQALMECYGISDYYGHLKALSLDSTFMLARVYIYHSSLSWEKDSVHEANRRYIKDHWDGCTEFERNHFDFVENTKAHRYEAAARALDENIRLDPWDLSSIHESAHFWLGINRPDEAAKRYEPLFDQYDVFKERLGGNIYRNYFDALNRLNRSKVVLELVLGFEAEDFRRMHAGSRSQLVRSLLTLGDYKQLERVLNLFRESGIDMDYIRYAFVYNELFPDDTDNFFANDLMESLDSYRDPEDSWSYGMETSLFTYNYRSKASAFYVLKEYEQAAGILLDLRLIDWANYFSGEEFNRWYMKIWVEGLLGAVYARQGKAGMAQAQLEVLESLHREDPKAMSRMRQGEVPYYQARIYAILGDLDLAVDHLRKSMAEGRMSEHSNFVQDWDLTSLYDYPPYQELLKVKN